MRRSPIERTPSSSISKSYKYSGANTPVGYIPTGSTNDFAGSLGLPLDPLKAAKQIIDGTPQQYDIGQFCGRFFTYVASFGAFTRSSYATSQSVKNALGHTAYVLGGISELSQIRDEHIRMEIDGEVVEDDFLFGAICNSTSIGGLMKLDPERVVLDDGKFELLLIPTNFLVHTVAKLDATAVLSPVAAVILVLISVGLTLIAGLIPSRNAANKDPVVALRSE